MAARRTAGRTCPFPDRSRRLRDVRHNVCGLDWYNMLGVMEDMLQYREYMAQALELARKGAGWVDPNPLVGAVMVRDGEVLATGYHDRYRGPHAERMAFDYADAHGIDLTGATVIDTLEPCCHVGSQPACTALILAHGIARVVVGSVDPNPIVAGKGLRILEEAGVEVVRDVMREECDAINRHFFHYITTGKPYIVDGRRRAGESDSEYAVRRANYMPHMRRCLPELNRTFLTSLSRISTDRSKPSAQTKW